MNMPWPSIMKLARIAVNVTGDTKPVAAMAAAFEKFDDRAFKEYAGELRGLLMRHSRRDKRQPDGKRDLPTPETVAKLRNDPVLKMYEAGTLGPAEMRSIEEIRDCIEAISRGLSAKTVNLDAVRVDGHGAYQDPIARMSERMDRVFSEVYVPWSFEMQSYVRTEPKTGKSKEIELTRIDFAQQVIMDGTGVRTTEQFFGVKHGSLAPAFRSIIGRFTTIFDSVTPPIKERKTKSFSKVSKNRDSM